MPAKNNLKSIIGALIKEDKNRIQLAPTLFMQRVWYLGSLLAPLTLIFA